MNDKLYDLIKCLSITGLVALCIIYRPDIIIGVIAITVLLIIL